MALREFYCYIVVWLIGLFRNGSAQFLCEGEMWWGGKLLSHTSLPSQAVDNRLVDDRLVDDRLVDDRLVDDRLVDDRC